MNTTADKTFQNTSKAAAHDSPVKQNSSAFQFADHRPESLDS
jgi:hypothetical protein